MSNVLLNTIEYSTSSPRNMLNLFVVGLACFIISAAFNNEESNGFQLVLAGVSKIGCYLFLFVASVTLVFSMKTKFDEGNSNLDHVYAEKVIDAFGGYETIESIHETLVENGFDMSDIRSIQKATESAKVVVQTVGKQEVNLLEVSKNK